MGRRRRLDNLWIDNDLDTWMGFFIRCECCFGWFVLRHGYLVDEMTVAFASSLIGEPVMIRIDIFIVEYGACCACHEAGHSEAR